MSSSRYADHDRRPASTSTSSAGPRERCRRDTRRWRACSSRSRSDRSSSSRSHTAGPPRPAATLPWPQPPRAGWPPRSRRRRAARGTPDRDAGSGRRTRSHEIDDSWSRYSPAGAGCTPGPDRLRAAEAASSRSSGHHQPPSPEAAWTVEISPTAGGSTALTVNVCSSIYTE